MISRGCRGNHSPYIVSAVVWPLLVCCLFPATILSVETVSSPRRVLILYWWGPDFQANAQFDQSLRATLDTAAPGQVEYYGEYLETNKFPDEGHAELLSNYLQQKYKDRPPDVIVANTDVALDFLLKNNDQLFPALPIVFVTAQEPGADRTAIKRELTGIYQGNTHRETVEIAMRLHPGTEHVFVVSGNLEGKNTFEEVTRQQLGDYEGNVNIEYLTDIPLDDLTLRLQNLPLNSIALYVWQQSRDEEGRLLNSIDFLERVAGSATVPVYAVAAGYIGHGAVGGAVSTPEARGVASAKIVLQILEGKPASDIPFRAAPTEPVFDWRQIQRWGIDEELLPVGSIVRFREDTFWEKYRAWVIIALAVVLTQILLIAFLLLERAERQRANHHLLESEQRFRNMADTAPVLVWSAGSDKQVDYVNRVWTEFTGRTLAQELGTGWADGVHRDDREQCLDTYTRSFDERRSFRMEYRLKRKDAQYRWLLETGVPRFTEGGSFVGYIGTAIDITELKLAEHTLRESERELNESRERAQRLSGKLINLQDEERHRIAAELHDSLGQSLAIIRNRATICLQDMANHDRVHEQLEEITLAAVSAIDEVREIAHNLRPYELDRLGLARAVESMVQKMAETTDLDVSFKYDNIDGILPAAAETSVYRIVQEGINNVLKHARARTAIVEIRLSARGITVTVEDDGIGMNNNSEHAGFGLAGIAQRARMLGADLEIQSQLGRGTRLSVHLGHLSRNNGR